MLIQISETEAVWMFSYFYSSNDILPSNLVKHADLCVATIRDSFPSLRSGVLLQTAFHCNPPIVLI